MLGRNLPQINILKSAARKINIAPPLRIVPSSESTAQDRAVHPQPRIVRDIRIRNPRQVARQPINVQSGGKTTVLAARKIEVSSAPHIAQAPVVRPLPVAQQNGIRIAHRSKLAPELTAQVRAAPPIQVAQQNGIRIAHRSTLAPELTAQIRAALPIQVAPQIRAKGKILTSPSALILRELHDNFAARQSKTSP
jgi:hypothetical protein